MDSLSANSKQPVRKNDGKKLHKPNNIITVPVDDDFFKWWCIFLRPFINLTNREIDVIAEFLRQRQKLSKITSDPASLDILLMSDETKKKVMEACNITQPHFYVVMSNLRKNHVIIGNILNPRLIPNIRKDDNGCFQLMILFKDK